MKLVTFTTDMSKNTSVGVVINDKVLDLSKVTQAKLPTNMLDVIAGGSRLISTISELAKIYETSSLIKMSEIKLLSPILNPPSLKDFFAFENHAKAGAERRKEKLPDEWYEIPAYYKGNHREIYGPEDEIPWPSYTQKLDFECEIACVIGKKGKNVRIEEANDFIYGYMIFNDISARDIQKKEMVLRMGPAKSKDFANIFGPYLVTKDEVNPKEDFKLKVKVNNELWSEGHFKDQFWGFPLLVSHVSQEETIYPGDILGSGTFYGGCGLDLSRWIKIGDIIELEVPKLGILRNKVGSQKTYKELNYKREKVSSRGA